MVGFCVQCGMPVPEQGMLCNKCRIARDQLTEGMKEQGGTRLPSNIFFGWSPDLYNIRSKDKDNPSWQNPSGKDSLGKKEYVISPQNNYSLTSKLYDINAARNALTPQTSSSGKYSFPGYSSRSISSTYGGTNFNIADSYSRLSAPNYFVNNTLRNYAMNGLSLPVGYSRGTAGYSGSMSNYKSNFIGASAKASYSGSSAKGSGSNSGSSK